MIGTFGVWLSFSVSSTAVWIDVSSKSLGGGGMKIPSPSLSTLFLVGP